MYEIDGEHLIIVTTDRISAYDVILSKTVKDKGRLLNAISLFWIDYTKDIVKNHVISNKLSDMLAFFQNQEYEGRTILVEKLKILPLEFIVRGYIFGNMWMAYQEGEDFCGFKIQGDNQQAQKLSALILTPSTKVSEGHDIYVSSGYVFNELDKEPADKIRDLCLKLYEKCYQHAYKNGIIIADNKFAG